MMTVKLQIDVTKFISSSTSRREPALTLFADNQQKTSLASKVILAGKNISDGFNLAFRIIQVFYSIDFSSHRHLKLISVE